MHVPVNTEAEVVLESSRPQSVELEGNHGKDRRYQDGQAIYTIGSGTYTFAGPR